MTQFYLIFVIRLLGGLEILLFSNDNLIATIDFFKGLHHRLNNEDEIGLDNTPLPC